MTAVSKTILEEEFEAQLAFLKKSNRDFDTGDYSEFRRLASALRVLLHRTSTSKPAVDHIGLDDSGYISYASPLNERNFSTEHSLAVMGPLGDRRGFWPKLDQGHDQPRLLTLSEWKEEPVMRDNKRIVFNRWELVLMVANKQGSHIDSEVDEKYHRLVRENSSGWIYLGPEGEAPILDLEKVYIRHIAFEALLSLERKWNVVLGNRGCNCGSGRKARYCCMKPPHL